jgi:hypothetical protein
MQETAITQGNHCTWLVSHGGGSAVRSRASRKARRGREGIGNTGLKDKSPNDEGADRREVFAWSFPLRPLRPSREASSGWIRLKAALHPGSLTALKPFFAFCGRIA